MIPVLAILVLAYTLFRNVYPFPSGAGWWGPGPAIAWLVAVLALVIVRKAATEEAGQKLTAAEGLTAHGGGGAP